MGQGDGPARGGHCSARSAHCSTAVPARYPQHSESALAPASAFGAEKRVASAVGHPPQAPETCDFTAMPMIHFVPAVRDADAAPVPLPLTLLRLLLQTIQNLGHSPVDIPSGRTLRSNIMPNSLASSWVPLGPISPRRNLLLNSRRGPKGATIIIIIIVIIVIIIIIIVIRSKDWSAATRAPSTRPASRAAWAPPCPGSPRTRSAQSHCGRGQSPSCGCCAERRSSATRRSESSPAVARGPSNVMYFVYMISDT